MNNIGAIFLTGYLIFSLLVEIKILRSNLISPRQKLFNSILIWIIPFLWGIIVLNLVKPTKPQISTKGNRKLRNFKFSDNWENLTGFGGDSSHL
jgi:hypothetical protein